MINPEKFLSEYEKMFGKGVDWFKASAVLRNCEEDNPSVTCGDTSLCTREAFERIAFEMKEERELAAWCINHEIERCEVCAKQPGWTEDCETWDGNCGGCGNLKCPCKFCSYGDHFYFSAVMAKGLKEKYEARRKKDD